jgi:Ca2+-binding EF-hand superfamily protein
MEFTMQKKTKLMLAVGTLSLLAIGGVAGLASADMGGHRMWGGHGMGHGKGGGMMGVQMMERYDANKDGKVSQEEIDQNRTSWHGEFDGDKNATLSIDEFQNLWLKARREQMVREFQEFDRDGNGQVTLEEYNQPMAGIVANRDRNGDGFLSRDDRRQRGEREGRRHERRGMGEGMGQGMGEGMMDEGGTDDAPPATPAAPANP